MSIDGRRLASWDNTTHGVSDERRAIEETETPGASIRVEPRPSDRTARVPARVGISLNGRAGGRLKSKPVTECQDRTRDSQSYSV